MASVIVSLSHQSPKWVGFIVWGPWKSVQNSSAIHVINKLFQPETTTFPSSVFYLHLYFRWKLNLTWLCCEAMDCTMCRDHCPCSKPEDKRAMYNETPAVKTAITSSESKHCFCKNNNDKSVRYKEKKKVKKANHWNTVVQCWLFVEQFKKEIDDSVFPAEEEAYCGI